MNDFLMYDVSALIVFGTLIISNISKHRMKGLTNSLYLAILIVSSVTIIFRLIFKLVLRNCEYSPQIVTFVRTMVYLSLISRSLTRIELAASAWKNLCNLCNP